MQVLIQVQGAESDLSLHNRAAIWRCRNSALKWPTLTSSTCVSWTCSPSPTLWGTPGSCVPSVSCLRQCSMYYYIWLYGLLCDVHNMWSHWRWRRGGIKIMSIWVCLQHKFFAMVVMCMSCTGRCNHNLYLTRTSQSSKTLCQSLALCLHAIRVLFMTVSPF